jgi:hypothetical protein
VLPLRITESELFVYGPHIEEIARHALLPPTATHQQQVSPGHRPTESRRIQDERLRESFAAFGEVGQIFLTGLLSAHRQGKAQARKILALRADYHHHDLVQALARAITYGAFSFSSVERILSVEAEPKTNLEILADQEKNHLCQLLKDASVRPRKTADYQKLLFPEQEDGQDSDTDSEDDTISDEGPSGEAAGPGAGTLPDPPRPDDPNATG